MASVLTIGVLLFGLFIGAYAVFSPVISSLSRPEDEICFVPKTLFAKSLLIFSATANCPDAKAQRRALQSILPVLLQDNFRIYEIYGGYKPCCNGQAATDLNGSLLRRCFNLDPGFHLVYVNDRGQHQFQTATPLDSHMIIQLANIGLNTALAQLKAVDAAERETEKTPARADYKGNSHSAAAADSSQFADTAETPGSLGSPDMSDRPDTTQSDHSRARMKAGTIEEARLTSGDRATGQANAYIAPCLRKIAGLR